MIVRLGWTTDVRPISVWWIGIIGPDRFFLFQTFGGIRVGRLERIEFLLAKWFPISVNVNIWLLVNLTGTPNICLWWKHHGPLQVVPSKDIENRSKTGQLCCRISGNRISRNLCMAPWFFGYHKNMHGLHMVVSWNRGTPSHHPF